MTRPEERNQTFLRDLPRSIMIKNVQDLHDKVWVTNGFYLRGSMNFTYFGLNINSESIEVSTDDESVAQAMVEARHQWDIA
jgi:hypothetical protein